MIYFVFKCHHFIIYSYSYFKKDKYYNNYVMIANELMLKHKYMVSFLYDVFSIYFEKLKWFDTFYINYLSLFLIIFSSLPVGTDINAVDKTGLTPLAWAAAHRQVIVLRSCTLICIFLFKWGSLHHLTVFTEGSSPQKIDIQEWKLEFSNYQLIRIIFQIRRYILILVKIIPGAGLPYETDGNACRLA